jgi:hypothetical protein
VKNSQKLTITEGIESVWHYHFSNEKTPTIALCGAQTMRTLLPISSWGHVDSHINQKYCKLCQRLKELGAIS